MADLKCEKTAEIFLLIKIVYKQNYLLRIDWGSNKFSITKEILKSQIWIKGWVKG